MLLTLKKELEVRCNIDQAFTFFCNPANDHLWRKEINKTIVEGALQVGTLVYEYSNLSKKQPDNLRQLRCTEWVKNNHAIYESVPGADFYLKSQRKVALIKPGITRLEYELEFDTAIVKFALGFSLPQFIISVKARSDMKKYMQQLKLILENASIEA